MITRRDKKIKREALHVWRDFMESMIRDDERKELSV
jgi:hypothetical protein